VLDVQRREKLKSLLITKFTKKYDIKENELILKEEISKFVDSERLTDYELKLLDERIKSLVNKKQVETKLKRELTGNQNTNGNVLKEERLSEYGSRIDTKSHHDDNVSVVSRMSGVSHLSKFTDKKKDNINFDEHDDEFNRPKFKTTDRLDFKEHGDEWNAIAQHNSRKFEDDKKISRLKDKEIKKKQKEALEEQMNEKKRKLNEEKKKNLEFDNVVLQNVDYLNQVEKDKETQMKNKILKEKSSRDSQLKDEKKRKQDDFKKRKEN